MPMVRAQHPLADIEIWKALPFLAPIKDKLPSWVPHKGDTDAEQKLLSQPTAPGLTQYMHATTTHNSSVGDDFTRTNEMNTAAFFDDELLGNDDYDRADEDPQPSRLIKVEDTTQTRVLDAATVNQQPLKRLQTSLNLGMADMLKKGIQQRYLDQIEQIYYLYKDEEDEDDNDRQSNPLLGRQKTKRFVDNEINDEDEDKLMAVWELIHQDDGFDPEIDEKMESIAQRRSSDKSSKKATSKDPVLKYGVGMKEYFFIQTSLIKSFLVLALLATIQMIIMGGFDGLDYLGESVSFAAKVSFGNMGFAQFLCSREIIDWNASNPMLRVDYECQGTTQISSVISSGLMLDSKLPHGTDPDSLRTCYFDEQAAAQSPLMPYFDAAKFNADLLHWCEGKQFCFFEFARQDYISLPADMQYENIIFFAQAGCSMDEAHFASKQSWGLAIACIGLYMAWYFRINVRYLQAMDLINEMKFDSKLVTVEDFAVKIKVTDSMIEKFNESQDSFSDDVQNILVLE